MEQRRSWRRRLDLLACFSSLPPSISCKLNLLKGRPLKEWPPKQKRPLWARDILQDWGKPLRVKAPLYGLEAFLPSSRKPVLDVLNWWSKECTLRTSIISLTNSGSSSRSLLEASKLFFFCSTFFSVFKKDTAESLEDIIKSCGLAVVLSDFKCWGSGSCTLSSSPVRVEFSLSVGRSVGVVSFKERRLRPNDGSDLPLPDGQ